MALAEDFLGVEGFTRLWIVVLVDAGAEVFELVFDVAGASFLLLTDHYELLAAGVLGHSVVNTIFEIVLLLYLSNVKKRDKSFI